MFGAFTTPAQEKTTRISFDFRANSVVVDSLYRNNASNLRDLSNFISEIKQDSLISVSHISFCGSASPDGSSEWNRQLANGRLSRLESMVRSEMTLPDSIISYHDSYIPWDIFRTQVAASDIDYKDEVLNIIDSDSLYVDYYGKGTIDKRIFDLQKLNQGKVWADLKRRFFNELRSAYAIFVTYRKPEPILVEPIEKPTFEPDTVAVATPDTSFYATKDVVEEPEELHRHIYLKTNGIGWVMAVPNLAVEVDMAPHWSATLPIYYSGWDYFSHDLKYRTLAFQPEVRYWQTEKNDGWFAGLHFGLAWYNIALKGDYRIQDRDGNTPALGGGVAVGYRLPLCQSGRWKLEFSLGAGVYALNYDKFRNEHGGLLVETKKKTFVGIDQASVAIAYTFDINKMGGRK